MDSKYVFTKKSSTDLDNILNYISTNLCNNIAANNLFNNIFTTIDNIVTYPLSYPIVSNEYVRRKDVRKAVIDNYNLYFIVKDSIIYVLRIIYNKRDLSELLNI